MPEDARPVRRLACLLTVLASVAPGVQADLFVSPRGSDANPGTTEKPLVTLEAARDALRALRKAGPLPAGGTTVWLQAGDHFRTRALELSAADSGSDGSPIAWRAVAGDAVRLLGGRRLEGFQSVTDPAVAARLDGKAREQVRWVDLRALGIEDLGGLASRGFGRATTPSHPELFHGGRPMTLARWPDEGAFEPIAGFPEAGAEGDGHGGKIGKLENGFFYAGDRPRRWQATSDIWVHGYWAWDWANSYEHVLELNADQHLIRTAAPHGLYGFRKGQRFYFLNVLEELDQPGEWYLDRQAGRLYFWPPTGPAVETVLSLLDQPFVRMIDVAQVAFRGLTFEATRATAVEIRGGASNRVAGCVIRNAGNHGVAIQGGAGHTIESCDILDTGDGGVVLEGGDRKTLTPAGHKVNNCHFQRQGRWSKCYVPAVQLQGVGMRVTHCLIHDHPHCAILWHAKPGMLRLENNLTDADPRFVGVPREGAAAADFALKPDSPAWALGFERIPLEQIGLRDDEWRKGLAAGKAAR